MLFKVLLYAGKFYSGKPIYSYLGSCIISVGQYVLSVRRLVCLICILIVS